MNFSQGGGELRRRPGQNRDPLSCDTAYTGSAGCCASRSRVIRSRSIARHHARHSRQQRRQPASQRPSLVRRRRSFFSCAGIFFPRIFRRRLFYCRCFIQDFFSLTVIYRCV